MTDLSSRKDENYTKYHSYDIRDYASLDFKVFFKNCTICKVLKADCTYPYPGLSCSLPP